MSSNLATPWSPVLSVIMDINDLVGQEIIFPRDHISREEISYMIIIAFLYPLNQLSIDSIKSLSQIWLEFKTSLREILDLTTGYWPHKNDSL